MSSHSKSWTAYLCVPTVLSSTNLRTVNPVDLSLERLTTRFSVSSQSMPIFSNTKLCLNRLPHLLRVGRAQGFCVCLYSHYRKRSYHHKSHRSSTFTKGIRELLSWLLLNKYMNVCMESKGKYWIPIYNIFKTDCKIVLVHPKYARKTLSG